MIIRSIRLFLKIEQSQFGFEDAGAIPHHMPMQPVPALGSYTRN